MIKKIKNIYFFLFLIYFCFLILMRINLINFYWQGIIKICLINTMLVASLNLATGFLGQLFLSHSAFIMLGAYFSAAFTIFLKSHSLLEFSVAIILSGFVSSLFAFALGKLILKTSGTYIAIITLAINEIISNIINAFTPGTIRKIEYHSSFSFIFIIAFLVLFIFYKLLDSRFGRAVKAVSQDSKLSRVCGIDVDNYKIITLLLSAFVAGMCGALYAHEITIIDTQMFDYKFTFFLLSMTVIGGLRNLTGSIISAVTLTFIPVLFNISEELKLISYIFLMILVLIFIPGGIFDFKNFDFKFAKNNLTEAFNHKKDKIKLKIKNKKEKKELKKEKKDKK